MAIIADYAKMVDARYSCSFGMIAVFCLVISVQRDKHSEKEKKKKLINFYPFSQNLFVSVNLTVCSIKNITCREISFLFMRTSAEANDRSPLVLNL